MGIHMIQRRTVLRGIGGSAFLFLSGCLGTDNSNGPDDDDDDDGMNEDDNIGRQGPLGGERVDTPPYDIGDPGDRGDWNEHYLGENMAIEPSLDFDVRGTRRGVLGDHGILSSEREVSEYWVGIIDSDEDKDEMLDLDSASSETQAWVDGIDFDERVLIAVESGFGSGSVGHRWARVEQTDEELHLHGYYTQPFIQTYDYVTRASLISVERPVSELTGVAHVSLTVNEDRRVNFNSTEGVVSIDD